MDLKFALRSLLKNPGFAILAVLVMGLGIGANTAVFSVVHSVLLKPLDYADPDRIVTLASLSKTRGRHYQVSGPDYHDWHDQSTSFAAMAYYNADPEAAVQTRSGAEYGSAASVSSEFFQVFQLAPAAGRLFSREEQALHGPDAALISYGYWQSHFGGDRQAIGQTLHLEGKAYPIVGVLPPGFRFPGKTDIWLPSNSVLPETTQRSAHNYKVIALLKPDRTLEQAQGEMSGIAARLEQQYPASNRNKGSAVTRMRDEMTGDVRSTLYLLLGAVALVLLIACANMANLLLAKSTSRVREMAIRAAVGAGRGRIARQLITESLALALLSGAAGLVLAIWGSNALVALAPKNLPRLAETSIDGAVLAFTFAVSVAASLIFGLAPAFHAARVDLSESLKQSGARSVSGGGAGRIRAGLVVAEIALSVVLLSGAGLLVRSFIALHHAELGFRPEHVLIMGSTVPAADQAAARRATQFYKKLLPEAAALPGVSAVGAERTPPGDTSSNGGYWIDHFPDASARNTTAPQAVFSVVAPGAFATLDIPVKMGRDFQDSDTYEAPFTVIVNESLVRQSFPGQNPIGHTLYCGLDSPKPMQIVGVVGDIRQEGPSKPPSPEMFMPYEQHPFYGTSMQLLVRTTADPSGLADALRRKASQVSPDVPVKFTTLEVALSENIAAPRFRTLLFSIFAGLAVCLAMAGVYGVMAYVVSQRSGEIGLRMALGASQASVLGMVLRQGLVLAGIGLVLGLAGSVAASRLLANLLFEVKPMDPLTYAGVAVLLAGVALAASYVPARRATRLDPLAALRQE